MAVAGSETVEVPVDDGPLVARAAAGDGDAFRLLVERHQARIISLLHRLCGCPERALDLAQETFLSAHRHLGSFRHESRFSTWLHSIAVNHARAAGRRRRPERSLDEPAGTAPGPVEPVGREPAPSARLEHADLARRVATALERIDERFREVVVLADMQGATYEEIATTLDIPVGTVRSRLHRGRSELRSLLVTP